MLTVMKMDVFYVVSVMCLLVCEGIEVKEPEEIKNNSKKSILKDMETSSNEYAFNGRGNEFKRYDTIGERGTDEFETFIKGDGFGNSNLNVANSIYGFNYPTGYKIRNIGKGTFGAESSLRRLGGQDSSLGNIEGFDYDGSDGFRIKGSFTRFQYYGLPRHAENYKLSRSKLGLGGMNIRLHSNLGTDTLRKSIGIQNVPYGNILENDLLTYDVIIPRLNLKNGFKNEIINNKYNFAISNISRYRDEKKIEVVEKFSYKYEDFDKDEKEAIGKSHLFGYQKDFAGTKKDDEEEDLKYDKNESAAKELSSESHGKNESHKKGHKTSGFHNVYHKDEYKKDTSFYDNKHVDEYEASCSSENNEHEETKGEQKNIQKLDAGYHGNEQAQKKVFLNGHRYRTAQGQDREASGKEHYVENAKFLKKDEQSAAKVEGDSLYLEKYY